MIMDIPMSDDTQESIEELLRMVQNDNQDNGCNLCPHIFKTLFLLLEENEKLTDYAHRVWIESKKTDMWNREIRESMQINRDEVMNEMYIFRDELRQISQLQNSPNNYRSERRSSEGGVGAKRNPHSNAGS